VIVALASCARASSIATDDSASEGRCARLRYAWSTPDLRDPLLAMAVVGIFAFNFT